MGLFKFFKSSSSSSSSSIKSNRTDRDRDRDGERGRGQTDSAFPPLTPSISASSTRSHATDNAASRARPTISSRFTSLPDTRVHANDPLSTTAPLVPPKAPTQLRAQSSLGIGQLKGRERTPSMVSTTSMMSKLRSVSKDPGGGHGEDNGFKSVPYVSTVAGRIPTPTTGSHIGMIGSNSYGSMANTGTSTRDKEERGSENDLPRSDQASSGTGTDYRIPSLHLDDDGEGVGWGILAGDVIVGQEQQQRPTRSRMSSSTSRSRLDSVEEREEVKQVAGLRQPLRGEAGGGGQAKAWRTMEEDEDDRPLALFGKQPRTAMPMSPSIPADNPSSTLVGERSNVESHADTLNSAAPSASQAPIMVTSNPPASRPSKGEPAQARPKSGFFGRRGSKSELEFAVIPSALGLEVPGRTSASGLAGLEASSAPTSPITSARANIGPGHRRNGSEGTLDGGPPSAWRKGSSSPPAVSAPAGVASSSSSGGGFPWRTSSKTRESVLSPTATPTFSPTSPAPSIYRTPSISKSTPSLLLGGFMKAKGKGKGKEKDRDGSLPMLDGEDPSFQLRSFRHISSAAEDTPWDVYTGLGAESVGSFEAVPFPLSPSLQPPPSSPQLAARPGFSTSRRSSTYSLGEEAQSRQIPAANFKQRRTSSSYSAHQDTLAVRSELDRLDPAPLTPTKAAAEGQEILVSPVKHVPDGDFSIQPNSAKSDSTGVTLLPRSHSSSALETLSSASSATLRDSSARSEFGRPANKGFIVSSRRTVSVSSSASGFSGFTSLDNTIQNGRPGSALGRYQAVADESETAHSPPVGELPPRPASVLAFSSGSTPIEWKKAEAPVKVTASTYSTAPELSASPESMKSDLRPTLAERLALAAQAAAKKADTNVPATAKVTVSAPPPVALDPRRVEDQATNSNSRSGVQLGNNSPRAGTKAAASWDLSSSDEDEKKPAGRKIIKPSTDPKPRTESMPSGIRRPPAPSVAFGEPLKAIGYVPLKGPAAGNPRPPPSHSRQSSLQSVVTRKTLRRESSESEDQESSESNDEGESLAELRQKRSSSSLASNSQGAAQNGSPSSTSDSRSSSMDRSFRAGPSKLRDSSAPPLKTSERRAPAPSAFAQRAPMLPLLSTDKSPSGSFLAAARSRHSPASSATGDTSSSGVPVTPLDLNSSSSDIATSAGIRAASGDRARSAEGLDGRRSRRVSFMDDEGAAEDYLEAEKMDRKRNERRRGEAKAASDLGNALNDGAGRDKTSPPNSYNPYFAGNPAHISQQLAQQQQQQEIQQQQQQAMYAMQMAQMNGAYQMNPAYIQMQMHQQAMAYAKYQYQVSVANAAMQAANEEWERASNVSGFHPAGAMAPGTNSPGLFVPGSSSPGSAYPMMSPMYAGSAYGGSTSDLLQHRYSSSASAAGSMYGPPVNAHYGTAPAMPRSQSSTVLADGHGGSRSVAGTPPRRQRNASDRTVRGPVS